MISIEIMGSFALFIWERSFMKMDIVKTTFGTNTTYTMSFIITVSVLGNGQENICKDNPMFRTKYVSRFLKYSTRCYVMTRKTAVYDHVSSNIFRTYLLIMSTKIKFEIYVCDTESFPNYSQHEKVHLKHVLTPGGIGVKRLSTEFYDRVESSKRIK